MPMTKEKNNVSELFPGKGTFSIDKLKKDLANLAEAMPLIAQAKKEMYDSYIEQGFTEEQALELVKAMF